MPNKRLITAEHLYNFEQITSLDISPDGTKVVYALQTVDRATEKKSTQLWLAGRGAPRQLTFGKHTNTAPKFSPDGKTLAFLSTRTGDEMQIHLLPMEGGEARPLTTLKGSIGDFHWSPDGDSFLVEFTKQDKDEAEREADEKKKKLGVVARHYTRMFYKYDGAGFFGHEQQHLWMVNARTGKATQITEGDEYGEGQAAISPDGKTIVFVSNRYPDPEWSGGDLFTVSTKGGRIKKLETYYGDKFLPSFSPDGKWVAFLGNQSDWDNAYLWIVAADGKSKPRNLTRKWDMDAQVLGAHDVSPAATMRPTWSPDGTRIYFQVGEHGSAYLKAYNLKTNKLEDVITDRGEVGAYAFSADHKRLAYFFGTIDDINQVHLREMATGKTRQLTKTNAWIKRLDLGKIEEVWFKGTHKKDLQGWILKPPGFRPGRKYPTIIEIHGGPQAQYGWRFFHEFYYLASQGYVVAFSNPRGGRGYGRDHIKAIRHAFGTVDYDDVMTFTDLVEKQPYVDKARMGVTGGSYGGFMTAWIIGKTNRFKSAVVQRAVTNWVSFVGNSDLNWYFERWMGNGPPYESEAMLKKYWRQSPISLMGKHVKTPTLITHSLMDQRVEHEQGEQLYIALKRMGVESELVLFPESPHGLSRVGRTDRRIVRLNHILRWMDKYLKK
ncbi:MAG: S9 family peptidase [Anaerolineae bacterium]|nr:MAG: S9 family peptidase [Anaerolineae bacterium]